MSDYLIVMFEHLKAHGNLISRIHTAYLPDWLPVLRILALAGMKSVVADYCRARLKHLQPLALPLAMLNDNFLNFALSVIVGFLYSDATDHRQIINKINSLQC